MLRSISLVVMTLLTAADAWAKKPLEPFNSGHQKLMANLLRRCEEGVAIACHDYGKILLHHRNAADKKRGGSYIRRACTLAYAPACTSPASVQEMKIKERPARVDAQGNPCNSDQLSKSAKFSEDHKSFTDISKGSLWEQAGAQAGDEILTVNGQIFSAVEQVGEAIAKGGAVVNVKRGGRETSLILQCP